MTEYRQETDLLGARDVPAEALWGIHTLRAMENFPVARRPVRPELIHAYGAVKFACARTNHELGRWDERTYDAIAAACEEMMSGRLDEHVTVDAFQGGAGTSLNMNVNEVLTNRALEILGRRPGEYDRLSPTDDLNLHQSTNDTYPTALKVAAIGLLRRLEHAVQTLTEEFQRQEKATADVVKIGRTQLQDAVPTTLGREMSAYAEALSRDRWRIYKCEERLRVVSLGGTAIGTGIGAPRQFIFRATEQLRHITGLGLARAENLVEATQNADVYVEVSGIVNALAVNLLKCCTDLRLLSSGPHGGIGEIRLPAVQAGSSIMPGKVNPVIPESVSIAAMCVMADHYAIAQACAMGVLELNAFLPLVAEKLLSDLSMLADACDILRGRCVAGIEADVERCTANLQSATALLTALVEDLGYERATEVAHYAQDHGMSVRDAVLAMNVMSAEQFDELVSPQRVTRLGAPKSATVDSPSGKAP